MPTPYGGEMRKLPYPLDEAVSIQAETETATGNIVLPDFPEDSDETITILHRWSLNQFVAMATCIDVGSDIAFGSQAINMWWIWSSSMVELCAEMIRCIEETEEVREALAQWFSDAVDNNTTVQQALERAFNPDTPGSEVPEEFAERNQYGAALGCDLDDGWGHIRDGLIERSFQRVTDVLEQIEDVTNNQEMLANFLNAMPVVGAFFDVIPATDWILWFDNVRAWMKEKFEAGDTIDLRDEIACDLFCIWQVNCSLSFEQIRRYFWDKTTELVPLWEHAFDSMTNLGVALSTLSEIDFGESVVYALVGSQFGFVTFVNNWFGITVTAIANDLALGEPSDDHETLCDDCPVICEAYDFTISDWSPVWNIRLDGSLEALSTYSAGVGYIPRLQSAGGYQNQIYTISSFECTTLEYKYTAVNMPSQVALFWCNSDFTVLSLAANLTANSGSVTDTIDLGALTPPVGATGYLLVSGDATSADNVVVWKEANFS